MGNGIPDTGVEAQVMAREHTAADDSRDAPVQVAPNGSATRRDRVRELAGIVHAAQRYAWVLCLKRAFFGLNRFFVHHVSSDGLRWHLEALRTGRPVAEVIGRHSLLQPVRRVLLIHRASGILLAQVQADATGQRDGDMISGMLTAIRDFVHDSLDVDRSEQLHSLRVGNLSVLIESGPDVVVAGILAGEAPASLRDTFRDCLRRIQTAYGPELQAFDGQTDRFAEAAPLMQPCLRETYAPGDERVSILTIVTVALPLILLVVWGGVVGYRHVRWRQYVEMLGSMPGIVVTEHGRRGGTYVVEGLRDPMAPDPEALLLSAGFVPREVRSRWSHFLSLDADTVLTQATRVLRPPRAVTLRFRDGLLVVEGEAAEAWVNRAREYVPLLPGVMRWDMDGLQTATTPDDRRWARFVERLESEPGLLIIETASGDGQFRVRGLRDPLARDPLELMREAGLDLRDVRAVWEPYVSLDPTLARRRAERILQAPPTVTLDVVDGTLIAAGEADHRWLARARLLGPTLEGFRGLDLAAVRDLDREAVEAAAEAIRAHRIYFLDDGRTLWPGQDAQLQALQHDLHALERAVARAGHRAEIVLTGRPKPLARTVVALESGLVLARRLREILLRADPPGLPIVAEGGTPLDEAPAIETPRREHLVTVDIRLLTD